MKLQNFLSLSQAIFLTFEGGDRNVGDECVQLVWGIFVFVSLAGQTHSHTVRHIPTM